LGNEDTSDTGLVTCQIPHITAQDPRHTKSSPMTVAQPSDYARSVSPHPAVPACDSACALSASFPDRSTSGGVNLMSRTTKDIVKVTAAAPQRLCVARASSFTTADYAERAQRMSMGSKLIHRTSSICPRTLKRSSADSVYQRSPSVIPTTPQGRRHSFSHLTIFISPEVVASKKK